jgi:hypothetical protein
VITLPVSDVDRALLLEGIDWRRPVRTHAPQLAV